MAWRLARSLATLLDQVNVIYPNRSKASDGTIGDAAHSARASAHNPHDAGVVCGLDITNDPFHGLDSRALAQRLLVSRDPRIKYLISNREIASGEAGPAPWKWRPYVGKNPHDKHCHISARSPAKFYDAAAQWNLVGMPMALNIEALPPTDEPMLREGVRGNVVVRLQKILNAKGAALVEDGHFGAKTRKAVIVFQKVAGMNADGAVGPYTWDALKS